MSADKAGSRPNEESITPPEWARQYMLTPEQREAVIAAARDGTLINLCWLSPMTINLLHGGSVGASPQEPGKPQ